MAEVIITGPEGRLEGRYHHVEASTAPLAVILHPHPQYGGNMNNRVVQGLAHMFAKRQNLLKTLDCYRHTVKQKK